MAEVVPEWDRSEWQIILLRSCRDMQSYQQAMLDLERTQVELAGKAQELGQLREIVVERDLAMYRLRKENESLRQGLRSSHHLQAEPDACEDEKHEDRL